MRGTEWSKRKEREGDIASLQRKAVCVLGWGGGEALLPSMGHYQVPTYGSRGYKPNLKHSTPLFLFFKYNIVFS